MAKKNEIQTEIQNTEMDWDSGISADVGTGEMNLPPVGEYGFKVIEFEKTLSKAGKKMAKIVIELDKEGQFWKVYDYLVLSDSMAWKLATFFESLSLKKKGEPLAKMPWDDVLGKTGRVKIKHETFDGKESCKVDRYLPSEASQASSKPSANPMDDVPFEV